jgi:hypothetical protein
MVKTRKRIRRRVLAWFASRWRNHQPKRAEKPHSKFSCEQLKERLLQTNLDYINADSEMQQFARRSTVTEHDGHTYRLLINRLQTARMAYELVHRDMVNHQSTHPAAIIGASA